MRTTIRAAWSALALLAVGGAAQAQSAPVKIGYVNTQALMAAAPGRAAAESTYAKELAAEVDSRDNITLQLRVGLNSGEVITGEVGSGPLAYTAVGEGLHEHVAYLIEAVG